MSDGRTIIKCLMNSSTIAFLCSTSVTRWRRGMVVVMVVLMRRRMETLTTRTKEKKQDNLGYLLDFPSADAHTCAETQRRKYQQGEQQLDAA